MSGLPLSGMGRPAPALSDSLLDMVCKLIDARTAKWSADMVKDPVQDQVVWNEYLETVVKERAEWKDLYRAFRELA